MDESQAIVRDGEVTHIIVATDAVAAEFVEQGMFGDGAQAHNVTDTNVAVGWTWSADEGFRAPDGSAPTEPTAPTPVTREELEQVRADLDWLITFATTGEG